VNRPDRKSQRSEILRAFLNAPGREVALPELLQIAAQYSARIFELRKQGFRITNRIKVVDGVRHSWFKLESSPAPTLPNDMKKGAATPAKSDGADSLFGDMSVQHLDLG
jgi:hypothetical protein